ncbi:MAG: hypothetical protein HKN47_23145 [Pirellulaceae bacterium]|nr:hypothetical protein [Pirellulaceae bacterium]
MQKETSTWKALSTWMPAKGRRRRKRRVAPTHRRRNLITQQLEDRRLLAVGTVEEFFRSDQIDITGSFTYDVEGKYKDLRSGDPSVPFEDSASGAVAVNGLITWDSENSATVEVDAMITGSGRDFLDGEACARYEFKFDGHMTFDVQGTQLTGINGSDTLPPEYTSWTRLLPDDPNDPDDDFDCEQIYFGPQTSPFETTALLKGTLRAADQSIRIDPVRVPVDNDDAEATVDYSFNLSNYEYQDDSPTDLVLSRAGGSAGDLAFWVSIEGKPIDPMPNQSNPFPASEVSYRFLARDMSILGFKEKVTDIQWNTDTVQFELIDLQQNLPPGAAYLEVHADALQGETNTVNNSIQIPLYDVRVQEVEMNGDEVFMTLFTLNPLDLPNVVEVEVVASNTRTVDPTTQSIGSFSFSPGSGPTFIVLTDEIPGLADAVENESIEYLTAVVDRDNNVFELDNHPIKEDNSQLIAGLLVDGASATFRAADDVNDHDKVLIESDQIFWNHDQTEIYSLPNSVVNLNVIVGDGDDTVAADEVNGAVDVHMTVFGGAGHDLIVGGRGEDLLYGDSGNDIVMGEGFATNLDIDVLLDSFSNLASGEFAFDADLTPIPGSDDIIRGGDGADFLLGGDGDDELDGGEGSTLALGDSFTWSASGNNIAAGEFTNFQKAITYVTNAIVDSDLSLSGDGNDIIVGGTGNNVVFGGGGGDTIIGGPSLDLLFGNEGGRKSVNPEPELIDGGGGFNFIVGGDGDETLIGGDDGNVIIGDDIAFEDFSIDIDSLKNLSLLRTLKQLAIGGTLMRLTGYGNDTIQGGAGFDFLVGGQGSDDLSGGDGLNIAFGDAVELQVGGFLGALGEIVDFAVTAVKIASVPLGNGVGGLIAGKSAVDDIKDIFNNLVDVITGRRLSGSNDDTYEGGSGTDIVFGGDGADRLQGGRGIDFVVGGYGDDRIGTDPGILRDDGFFDDIGFGGPGDDIFIGSSNNDYLESTIGDDVFYGQAGNDVLIGGDDGDQFFGGPGEDRIRGDQGVDLIISTDGIDTVADEQPEDIIATTAPVIVTTSVDVVADDGVTSLREAVIASNAPDGPNIIQFDPQLTSAIVLDNPLPIINRRLALIGPPTAIGLPLPVVIDDQIDPLPTDTDGSIYVKGLQWIGTGDLVVPIGSLGSGVAIDLSQSTESYLMYSEQSVQTRLDNQTSLPDRAEHLAMVRQQNEQWEGFVDDQWVPFQVAPGDRLLASVDVPGKAVTPLVGSTTIIDGLLGGSIDDDIQWDVSGDAFTTGILSVQGTSFATTAPRPLDDATTVVVNVPLGPSGSGVAVSDDATGDGYLMYSVQRVHDRFGSANIPLPNADHLIAVRHDAGVWQFNDNAIWHDFVPTDGDRLIAAADFDRNQAVGLRGTYESVHGIATGILSSDVTFNSDRWHEAAESGEFFVAGSFFEVPDTDDAPEQMAVTSVLDVNRDGDLTPGDIIDVINFLAEAASLNEATDDAINETRSFNDSWIPQNVNGDNDVSPQDILMIINELAERQFENQPAGEWMQIKSTMQDESDGWDRATDDVLRTLF